MFVIIKTTYTVTGDVVEAVGYATNVDDAIIIMAGLCAIEQGEGVNFEIQEVKNARQCNCGSGMPSPAYANGCCENNPYCG